MFWARAAPKHCYLHAVGRPVLPSPIIYAPFALSYWCGYKCRRDPVPAKGIGIFTMFWARALLRNIATYKLLGGQCSQTLLFTQHLASLTVKSLPQALKLSSVQQLMFFEEFTLRVLFVAYFPAS